MSRFKICEYCGSSLDPCERCDCQKTQKKKPATERQLSLAGKSIRSSIRSMKMVSRKVASVK